MRRPTALLPLALGFFLTLIIPGDPHVLGETPPAVRPPNVLFLAIDDLRSDLGSLGVNHARTPRLDQLAAQGRPFSHHYVQVPTCGASRCALLRGRYPDQPAHLGNGAMAQTHAAWGQDSLPACFRRAGYQTLALGKVTHHPGGLTGRDWAEGPEELPGAWTRCWIPDTPWRTAEAMMHGYANGRARQRGVSPAIEAWSGPDHAYPDAWVADEATATLKDLARSSTPWFLAVGLFKPHLPFAAPRHWLDAHDADRIPEPVARDRRPETGAWHGSGEFRGNYGHEGRDPERDPGYARELRHAYAAAVSYMDAQAGRILDALDDQGLADSTLVVLWSDHGFLLGEQGIWGKHCLYEPALRSPLIIRVPGQPKRGQPSAALVETIDLFPTLAELCGVQVPGNLQGHSLVPQIMDPSVPSRKPALGFWTQGQRTVRTPRWRYIDLGGGNELLFDALHDPHEQVNLARTEEGRLEIARLRRMLPEP